jgi:hypothetical protein
MSTPRKLNTQKIGTAFFLRLLDAAVMQLSPVFTTRETFGERQKSIFGERL